MIIPSDKIITPETVHADCELYILREDKRGLLEGGNKFFKLKYNLEGALQQGYDTVLSFGGAYSNHIAALAAAGKRVGLKTIGIIRGQERPESETIRNAINSGMTIHYVSREAYRTKDNSVFIADLEARFGRFYLIPEGGSNDLGIKGCGEILNDISQDYDLIAVPAGTGATAAGILKSLPENKRLLVFQVLKGEGMIRKNIELYLDGNLTLLEKLDVIEFYHFGGYARTDEELLCFIRKFNEIHHVPLDHVYTAKMMFGIIDMLGKRMITGKKIIAVHTGGLQGSGFWKGNC